MTEGWKKSRKGWGFSKVNNKKLHWNILFCQKELKDRRKQEKGEGEGEGGREIACLGCVVLSWGNWNSIRNFLYFNFKLLLRNGNVKG